MPKRTTFQRENDLLEISRRYLRGERQAVIAEALGQTQQTISNDLRALQSRWLAASVMNVDARKAQELAKVDNLELTYWAAWEHSLENAEVQTVEKQGVIHDKDGKVVGSRVKQTDRQEGQSGNPAFLKGVEWCINKRCELLGLDAPKKIAPTDPSGEN